MKSIPLNHGKVAIVDDEDYGILAQYRWYAHKQYRSNNTWVAQRRDRHHSPRIVIMHRQILGLAYGDRRQVAHLNGNRLDNRRSNLRICSHKEIQGGRKSSNRGTVFKGVIKSDSSWAAYITSDRKTRRLGTFRDPVVAALAYDKAAREIHGEFALLNFPDIKEYDLPSRRIPSSMYRGVSWYKAGKKWKATIGVRKTLIHIGYFESEIDAALAYDKAAREAYGDSALLNFPDITTYELPSPRKTSSIYKGVSWYKAGKKWKATIGGRKMITHLGYFDSELEAAIAYDHAAVDFYGDDAKLNFPIVNQALHCKGTSTERREGNDQQQVEAC